MKKLFTLSELIVVIIVLGILSAIAVPSISNFNKEANMSALKNEARSIEVAVDMYIFNRHYRHPTQDKYSALLGKPKEIIVDELIGDYIRKKPKKEKIHWYLDYTRSIYPSLVQLPKNITVSENDIRFEKVDGAVLYNVVSTDENGNDRVVEKVFESKKILIKEDMVVLDIKDIQADGKILHITVVDSYGFETPLVN